ncbi:MAG: HDOD domain-containing protein [Hylemonella sp.]|uniref:HDOD domain-containing protein n=1 Tax=Hylemonella sp. TaxID=2066020 RepID=UPI00391ABA2F
MTSKAARPASLQIADIDRELDQARAEGPVRNIVIPPCPELLTALQLEMRQPDPDPAEVTRIAGSDVAMAAALLRLANSPLYSRARPAHTVAEAVSLLGLGQTAAILTGFLARSSIPASSPLLEHFWETSTRRSLAMAFIARQLYGVDAEIAQTCGLFMHVGLPILLQGLRGYAGTLAEALARQDRSYTETENAAHHTDHAVVGAIVARTWHLPPVIAFAIRLHHDFHVLRVSSIPAGVRTLVALAAVAEHLVADFEGVQTQHEWAQHGPACLAYLQIGESEVGLWIDTLHPVFESVVLA